MSQLQHKQRLLRKVKFNNGGGATVSWTDIFWNPETNSYVRNSEERTSDAMVHDDFTAALAPFREHWLIFGEEVAEPKANYPFDASLKNLERVNVTSVTFSGGDSDPDTDDEPKPIGVHIQGTFRLKCGRVKNYCLPGIKLGSPQEKYKFASHVDQHAQALEEEAWKYLDGKCAPPAQTSMDFDAQAAEATAALPVAADIAGIGAGTEEGDE
jgi:hypothetical protein